MKRFWSEWINLNRSELINRSILSIQYQNRDLFFLLNDQSTLVISLQPQKPLLYCIPTDHKFRMPLYTRFDDILASAVITDVVLKDDDQIVIFTLTKKTIFGEIHTYPIILELIPRFVNLVIIENDRIRAAFTYFSQTDNPRRPVLMHQPYRYPDPPLTLRDAAYLESIGPTDHSLGENLNEHIQKAHQQLSVKNHLNPKPHYQQLLQCAIRKNQKLLVHLNQEIEDNRKADQYLLYGQLLQSNFQAIPFTSESISLSNFFSPNSEMITILLDPNKTPSEQIDYYFKKYKKMKKAAELQEQRIILIQKELQAHQLQLELIDQTGPTELEQKIKKLQIRLNKSQNTSFGTGESLSYHEYRLPSGKPLLVGKSKEQNDQLTFKVARPFDFWFHARDFKGSHVIIRLENKSISLSRQDIELSAGIAAYYSKARHSNLVPVDYTLRRYLRKPQNAAPGFVIVQREKTVMVKPVSPHELVSLTIMEVT